MEDWSQTWRNYQKQVYACSIRTPTENTIGLKVFTLLLQPFGVRAWSDVGAQRVFFHHFLPTP